MLTVTTAKTNSPQHVFLGTLRVNELRVLPKTQTHSTYALIFGGKNFACPTADWQATGWEKLFTNYYAFSFLRVAIYSKTFKLYFVSSLM